MHMLLRNIVIALSIAITTTPTHAQSSDQVDSDSALPLVERLQQLPVAQQPLQTSTSIEEWASQHAELLGLSAQSSLNVQLTAVNSRYQIARLQQQINGIEIFAHRSTLLIRDGQPYSLSRVTTDLSATEFPQVREPMQVVKQLLSAHDISISDRTYIKPIYARDGQQLSPAWNVSYGLERHGKAYNYELLLSHDGRILEALPREYSIDYKLVDVDQMCQVMGINFDITANDLFVLTENYEMSYGFPNSAASATTTMSRRLGNLLDKGTEFLQLILKQPGLDAANNVELYAFVGTRFGDNALNCGNNYGTNANFMAVNDQLAITQIHAPFLNNPEVILHELAHGIVFYGSGLEYLGESGALNEAFSDAVGVSYAAWANGRSAAPSQRDWQLWIGTTDLLRDFAYPRRVTQVPAVIGLMPDHYSERYVGRADHGGVHYNSSIINHAFYLLAEGGQHRRLGGVEVPKIGMDKALQLWHFAATRLLTQVSDFRDARYAFADAAEILFGEYGMERTAVHKAFDAVGIKGEWVEKIEPPKVDPLPKPDTEVEKPQQPKQQPKVELPNTPPADETLPPQQHQPWQLTSKHIGILAVLLIMTMGLWLVLRRAKPGAVQRYGDYQPYQPAPAGGDAPMAKQRGPGRVIAFLHHQGERYPLTDNQLLDGITVGRSSSADIVISNASVSSFHLKLTQRERQLRVEDLGSSYGTWLNGERISTHQRYAFHLPAQLRLADVSISLSSDDQRPVSSAKASSGEGLRLVIKGKAYTLTESQGAAAGYSLGRGSDNDIVIDNPTVSSRHGRILYRDRQWWYEDLNSSYGSAVKQNNQKVPLNSGERIRLQGISKLYLSDCSIEINGNNDGTIVL